MAERSPQYGSWAWRDVVWTGHVPRGRVPSAADLASVPYRDRPAPSLPGAWAQWAAVGRGPAGPYRPTYVQERLTWIAQNCGSNRLETCWAR